VVKGHRARLVQEIFAVGKKLNQSPSTLNLGVKLMDRVFSICPEISPSSYDLIANGCLLLGAKFEELDMKIPMIIDI
jgi:hypothetical protein